MAAPKEDVKKGPPLTCILCKGVLILNAEGFKMHLGSKQHILATLVPKLGDSSIGQRQEGAAPDVHPMQEGAHPGR